MKASSLARPAVRVVAVARCVSAYVTENTISELLSQQSGCDSLTHSHQEYAPRCCHLIRYGLNRFLGRIVLLAKCWKCAKLCEERPDGCCFLLRRMIDGLLLYW
jgi:hypothetical protein